MGPEPTINTDFMDVSLGLTTKIQIAQIYQKLGAFYRISRLNIFILLKSYLHHN